MVERASEREKERGGKGGREGETDRGRRAWGAGVEGKGYAGKHQWGWKHILHSPLPLSVLTLLLFLILSSLHMHTPATLAAPVPRDDVTRVGHDEYELEPAFGTHERQA